MNCVVIKTDLRSMFGPVRDQHQRPTCLAFAISDAHAAVRGQWSALSCEFVFYHAQRRANRGPTEGALLNSMLDALRFDGQPNEAGWPYLMQLPTDKTQWKPPQNATPIFRRASEVDDHSFDNVISHLDNGRPVLMLLMLSSSFDTAGSNNGYVDPGPDEQPDMFRRHAVVALGHGEHNGKRAVLIRNSWGDGWGDHGHAWLSETYLESRIFGLAILRGNPSVSGHTVTA